MKISYNWLKEFVDVSVSARELSEKLTFSGIKLEGTEHDGEDTIFDFEIVVNRPDWLSIHGVAREVGALYGLEVKKPYLANCNVQRVEATEGSGTYQGRKLRIVLEDPDLCPRYCGQIITGVKVGPSPEWVQQKITKCGMRPVNNVVDITNLVMLELGQPLHAFDYEKISEGTIRVRRAHDEKFVTLDGKDRVLKDPMLIIADARVPVGIGGVMGGKDSEVTESTTTLLLESAYFEPASIRKTRRALDMSTDASYRFERGADHNMQAMACRRAAFLFEELAGGKYSEVLQVTARRFSTIEVPLRASRVQRVLGVAIEEDSIHRILLALGFQRKSDVTWEVPSYRVDVHREIDLIEEIARHHGYNSFPDTLPETDRKYQADYPSYMLERRISDLLRASGIDEASTYSFVNAASVYVGGEPRVKILNPISETASELRSSLLPGLYEAVEFNIHHRNETVKLFEIGRVFLKDSERISLGIAMTTDFRVLKGIIQELFPALNYPAPSFEENKIIVGGHTVGSFQQRAIGPFTVQACEIFITDWLLLPQMRHVYREIIPYPFVQRDVTFLLPETVIYGDLEKAISALAMSDLQSFQLIDIYKGSNTPAGKTAFTFRLVFQRRDRTLTSEEVDTLYDKIVNAFASQFGAELRK